MRYILYRRYCQCYYYLDPLYWHNYNKQMNISCILYRVVAIQYAYLYYYNNYIRIMRIIMFILL